MNLQTFHRSYGQRRTFNPAKKEDLLELKHFTETGKWKDGCPFYVEDPFIEIPAMCYFKCTQHLLMHV